MDFLTNAGAFVVVLGLMIFFHEFGHFITAKAFGMRVFIFSFGFGTRLFGFKWGDTDCRVSLIPLGGYVKLEGEPDDRLSEDVSGLGDGRDFGLRPRWQRFLVYLAGPVMNGVLTVMVLTGLYMVGIQMAGSLQDRPIVGAVEQGSPAAAAGLLPGDEILAIDGEPMAAWEDAAYAVAVRPDATVQLRVRRDGVERAVAVRSRVEKDDRTGPIGTIGVSPLVRLGRVQPGSGAEAAGLRSGDAVLRVDGKPLASFGELVPLVAASKGRTLVLDVWRQGEVVQVPVTPQRTAEGYKMGVEPHLVMQQYPFFRAVREAVRWSWQMTRQTFDVLGRLLTAQLSPKTMMGPLGIAQASGDAARGGVRPLFYLVAVISLQIGILNLFPLPPLDGGHLAILAGESVWRRDLSMNAKAWIMNAGAMVLFLLIGLVLYSDLSKTQLLGKYLP